MNDLSETARRWGIEGGYHDVFGKWHEVGEETLRRLVENLSAGHEPPPAAEITALSAHPVRCWQGDGRRLWGIAVQLYALRSQRNWGHGDFTDLERLIDIAGACGASAVGLNPLHALFVDRPEQTSPYAPNSRLFLNPLYIDVEAVPEFPGLDAAGLAGEIARLRQGELIDYPGVAAAKLAGLRVAYGRFVANGSAARRADFDVYRAEQGDPLLRYACFEVLRQAYPSQPWWDWPEPWRRPARETLERLSAERHAACEFQEFLQWTADRQQRACMEAAKRRGLPIGLYIDFAVGVDPAGADAWSRQDEVIAAVSIGAPPDEFNPGGQNWGLAPFNPLTLPADDFAPIRQLMRATMRYAGAIRLDHVLGFKRMFLIPHGCAGGAYVDYPFEPLLRVIGEESCRHRCIVIGEDLGTVPEGFRDTTHKWGLWGYRVMLFERAGDGRFRYPESYPDDALATFTTHDLPTFRGWVTAHDIAVKRGIGVDPGESDEARGRARGALRDILAERASGYAPEDVAAVAAFLGTTPSKLVMIALDDVVGEFNQTNIPGTVHEHPNWRRKLAAALEELPDRADLHRVAAALRRAGRSFKE